MGGWGGGWVGDQGAGEKGGPHLTCRVLELLRATLCCVVCSGLVLFLFPSRLVLPCFALSCLVLLFFSFILCVSFLVLSCLVLSCLVLSFYCLVLFCVCLVLSCLVLYCIVLPRLVLF